MKRREMKKSMTRVKRKGFFLVVVVLFITFTALCLGFVFDRSMRRLKMEAELARKKSVSDNSFVGIKYAEDWIISAVLSEGFPAAVRYSADGDPMRRIEAVRRDGTSISGVGSAINAELYVADADYDEGLFTGSLKNRATSPFVPVMPCIDTDDETRRYYFLRSSSPNGDGVIAVREELLGVTMDKRTLDVSAERIFFRMVGNSN